MTRILCDHLGCVHCNRENVADDVGVCMAEKIVLLNGVCDTLWLVDENTRSDKK
jgi:hypothetical protein